MKEIEIEYKNKLTKKQHQILLDHIDFEYYVEQINYYFETTENDLKKNNMSLRVRNIDDKYYLMLKQKDGVVADETNIEISFEAFKYMMQENVCVKSEIKDILDQHHINEPLSNQATLRTNRYYTPYKKCVLFLDESHYYGEVDYELELESPSLELGKTVFEDLLKSYNIDLAQSKGKRSRAYKKKQSL